MSFTTTEKRRGSAAGMARAISSILRKAGYRKSDTNDRVRWTEGFIVHRVGYSTTVHVDYHVDRDRGDRNYRKSQILQMREDLFEAGYVSSHPDAIYIECTHP